MRCWANAIAYRSNTRDDKMLHTASDPALRSHRVPSLAEAYQRVFESMPANAPHLLEAAHRIRYQIFCVENQIFDTTENPDGLERDEYDSHSLHALLFYKVTQEIVGTVRLVFHKPGMRHGSLPLYRVCHDPRLRNPDFLPLETTVEIGRFAITKAFRRREGDGKYGRFYGYEELVGDPRRLIPHVTLGLMTTALQMSIPRGIQHVCAVMEPSLCRLLARFGIHFEVLGPEVQYYGLRQPCYSKLAELLARIELERPEVWEVITDGGRLSQSSLSSKRQQFSSCPGAADEPHVSARAKSASLPRNATGRNEIRSQI